MAAAMLATLDNWSERVEEIASHAIPGNRVRALSLLKDMEQVKLSLRRISGLEPDA
jgi:hypothetical protein